MQLHSDTQENHFNVNFKFCTKAALKRQYFSSVLIQLTVFGDFFFLLFVLSFDNIYYVILKPGVSKERNRGRSHVNIISQTTFTRRSIFSCYLWGKRN